MKKIRVIGNPPQIRSAPRRKSPYLCGMKPIRHPYARMAGGTATPAVGTHGPCVRPARMARRQREGRRPSDSEKTPGESWGQVR